MDNYRSSELEPMNTTRVPSGFEVESATLHVPTYVEGRNTTLPHELHTLSESSWKEKLTDTISGITTTTRETLSDWTEKSMHTLDEVKVKSVNKVNDVKQQVNASIERMKPVVAQKVESLQTQMKTDTVKWAGIAAGAGLGVGLIGRMVRHHYVKYHGTAPQIVVISGAC